MVNNDNPWDFSDWGGHANTSGGNNTVDRIFLLSIDEVLRYFGDSGLVASGAMMGANAREESDYEGLWGWFVYDQFSRARRAIDLGGTGSWWWLRSPGGSSDAAASVGVSGRLRMHGDYVFLEDVGGGIRPALWLYLQP